MAPTHRGCALVSVTHHHHRQLLSADHFHHGLLGLDADYSSITDKPNKDGFLLTLQQIPSNAVGTDNYTRYLRVDFCKISGKDICVVYVKPARREVFVAERTVLGPKQSFYIRVSNATKSLEGTEMLSYIRQHWGM